ncbi:hypothetical protein PVAND_014547 [Polypedilum vanderplanki]|nr:hypothetical protein PVAND_014547 [Polypedilum vanderplanki]
MTLIENLKLKCPYDDEILIATTEKPKCFNGNFDDFTCEVKKFNNQLQNELAKANQEIQSLKISNNQLQLFANELLNAKAEIENQFNLAKAQLEEIIFQIFNDLQELKNQPFQATTERTQTVKIPL